MPDSSGDLPRSFWQRTSAPIADDPWSDRADVLIAGAGLTGIATAVMLARAGRGVTVLEARSVGAVTTGGTTGKLSLLQGSTASGIRSHAGDDVLAAYLLSNRAAQEWVRREAGDDPAIIQTRSAFTYSTTPEGDATLRAEAEALEVAGVPVELEDAGAGIGLPFPVSRALRLEGQSQIHALRLVTRLIAELRRLGGRVVQGVRITGVELAEDGVRVLTTASDVRARQLVLATGTPILDRGLFFAKVVPSRSLAATYRLPPGGAQVPNGMYLSVDTQSRSLRGVPDETGELLIAGGGGFIPGRVSSVSASLDELDAWVREHFAGAARVEWWAAQDYRMTTHVPFAGPLPRGGGRIYAATGYNKWGMTNAVASAMAITGLITEDPPEWAEGLRAHAPGVSDVGEALAANAQVAGELVAGWTRAETSAAHPEPPAEGAGRIRRAGLTPVAESTVGGRTCRLSAVCTHLGGIVSWNDAERTWDCPLHGSRFGADGRLLEGPAVTDLPAWTEDADERSPAQA